MDYLLSLRNILFESMLNRRILRIKVFKTIYCYAENQGMTLRDAETMLSHSCESSRDLYLFILSLVGSLTETAALRIEAVGRKFNPTEEERNPNLKFVRNRIAALLAEDPDFSRLVARKKLSWEPYDAFLSKLYMGVSGRKYFKTYLDSGVSSLEEDAALWCRIFERELEDNADLAKILEDISIYWADGLVYVLGCCRRTLRSLGDGGRWSLPALYMSELNPRPGMTSDREFVAALLRGAYTDFEDYAARIAALTPKWNRDRICTTDLVLIICGMAEAAAFPGTPARIIINEYVELSKGYSTPESSAFVNGLLDKLIGNHQD